MGLNIKNVSAKFFLLTFFVYMPDWMTLKNWEKVQHKFARAIFLSCPPLHFQLYVLIDKRAIFCQVTVYRSRTLHKMHLILRSIGRIPLPKMQSSMARKFTLQLSRRYNEKHTKMRYFTFDPLCLEKTKEHRLVPTTILWFPSPLTHTYIWLMAIVDLI
jgi:hypothetical protein